jgi:hypothetical protein
VFTQGVNEFTRFITLYTEHAGAKFSEGSVEKRLNIQAKAHINKKKRLEM